MVIEAKENNSHNFYCFFFLFSFRVPIHFTDAATTENLILILLPMKFHTVNSFYWHFNRINGMCEMPKFIAFGENIICLLLREKTVYNDAVP